MPVAVLVAVPAVRVMERVAEKVGVGVGGGDTVTERVGEALAVGPVFEAEAVVDRVGYVSEALTVALLLDAVELGEALRVDV